jgi:hypothetical protein
MVTDGGFSVAAISSALNFGYRSVQTAYEFQGVPEQTRKLLATIETSKKDIQLAKSLRAQKSRVLTKQEKDDIDEKITDTEAALDGLEALVEAPRVDMMTKFGQVKAWNRTLWVVRDAAQVNTSLARVSVAMTALNRVITVMCLREGDKNANELHSHSRPSNAPSDPPPTYNTSEFLHQHRILRNSIYRESRTTATGSDAWVRYQDAETVPEAALPERPNSDVAFCELDGLNEHLPFPSQQANSRPIPDCLRAGPTALELFGQVEDTTRARSRAAWLQEQAIDTSTYPYDSTPHMLGDTRDIAQMGRNNNTRLAWEVLNEAQGDQPVRRRSRLAHRASFLS